MGPLWIIWHGDNCQKRTSQDGCYPQSPSHTQPNYLSEQLQALLWSLTARHVIFGVKHTETFKGRGGKRAR